MFSLPTSLPLLKVPSVSTTIASGARLVFEYGGGGGGGDMRLGIKAHENVNLKSLSSCVLYKRTRPRRF